MLNLRNVPLKKTSNVDLEQPLTNLIKSMYSTADDPEDFSVEISDLQRLRKKVTLLTFEDKNDSFDDLFRYYDQICELEKRIPLNDFLVPFKWKNAYESGYIFNPRTSLTISSLNFEIVAILFNCASALSKQAVLKNIDNDEELKLATKYFQQAAGMFDKLKIEAPLVIAHREPTSDLSVEALRYLSLLMLAQAQELFIQKAIKDKMKNAIVAKLCKQCELFYEELIAINVPAEVSNFTSPNSNANAKLHGYHALAEYFQSLICKENKHFGEEIARLQNSAHHFKKQQALMDKIAFFQTYASITNRNLEEVIKYNNLIYNVVIPQYESLASIEKTVLAKLIPVQSPLFAKFKDSFRNLIPVVVHQALAAYDIRKNDLINNEINQLREADQILNGVLASLNLPAAIEVTSGNELPQSIIDKAKGVKESGGIEKIQKLIADLPELLKVNNDMLVECENMLSEEKESDDNVRKQFKTKWNRTPSEKLQKVFISNIGEYRILINKATEADKFVRNKFENARKGIEILSLPLDEIKKRLPGQVCETNKNCDSAKTLRLLMTEVQQLKDERGMLEIDLKSKRFDIKEKLLKHLTEEGSLNEEQISMETLHENYLVEKQKARQNVSKQEELIEKIKKTHEKFATETGQTSDSHEDMLKELATAYDSYKQLMSNLQEGNKFYNDLIPVFVVLQNKIKDYCSARKIEKEELLRDLSQSSARSTESKSQPKPNVPSYYESTSASSSSSSSDSNATDSSSGPTTAAQLPPPYPLYSQTMPMPYANPSTAPYPPYCTTVLMPQGYNPFMAMPFSPVAYQNVVNNPYATYPRSAPSNNQNH